MSRFTMAVGGLIALAAFGSVGCRSIGRFPGIDPTDYAYSYFNGKATQVYQFTVPQVVSSALEALDAMGFKEIDCTSKDGVVKIHAKTLDHRPARVTVRPRNAMAVMSVMIGLEGDEMVSEALIQRVALNFGTIPRTIIPLEPTLRRRIDPPTLPRPVPVAPLMPLLPPADPPPPARLLPDGPGLLWPGNTLPEVSPAAPSLPEPLMPEMPLLP